MPFYKVDDLPVTEMLDGVFRRAVYLEGLMLTFFDFEPGLEIPEHAHPHEQISYVLAGEMVFTLDGETRTLRAGEGATIPPDVPHGAVFPGRARVMDAFHPVREDYR
ncbi:MAG: cupin domain-containing protein [Anaerolineae bacterium]|nr:MAG: cupin domain-containing protein [Anaerolineae bacterium]